jgi:hypothetical protein
LIIKSTFLVAAKSETSQDTIERRAPGGLTSLSLSLSLSQSNLPVTV